MTRQSKRRIRRRILWALVLLAAVGGWAWYARPWEEPVTAVTVLTATPGPASEVLAVNGQIIPGEKVDLAAPVSGTITEVLAKEGDAVSKGDVLARLDDTIARAGLEQAEASLESARIDARSAQATYDRAKALTSTISDSSRDSARFAAEAAAARVRQLEAAVAQARRELEFYHITTPIDGTVLDTNAELGQVVGSANILFALGDLAKPQIETEVDEIYGARMRTGLSARVAPVGASDHRAAHVSFVAPTVDRDTGGRTVRLSFDEALESPLPSGLTMSVNIEVETFEDVFTLPRSAIRALGGDPYVLVERDGRAAVAPITVRDWPSERLVVTSGIAPGDRVIVYPQDVTEGALVANGEAGGGEMGGSE